MCQMTTLVDLYVNTCHRFESFAKGWEKLLELLDFVLFVKEIIDIAGHFYFYF